jgi:hypothetical protein
LWIAERFENDFDHELDLCSEFLKQDQRNFHCWNYRRSIHDLSGRSDLDEFAFSTDKIRENFSNYSAFHHRSKYLSALTDPLDVTLSAELQIVENAIFTEPDDQSAWWYHQFLLRFAQASPLPEMRRWMLTTLYAQLHLVDDLLTIEEDSRWAMNCMVFMIDLLLHHLAYSSDGDSGSSSDDEVNKEKEEAEKEWLPRREAFLQQLIAIDPPHINRYKYLLLHRRS